MKLRDRGKYAMTENNDFKLQKYVNLGFRSIRCMYAANALCGDVNEPNSLIRNIFNN